MALPNATRENHFLTVPRTPVDSTFQHTPPSGAPAAVVFPDTLNAGEQAEITGWRSGSVAYEDLSGPAQAKADEYRAFEIADAAYKLADRSAREAQWHWFRVDVGLGSYPTVPRSSDPTGVGSDEAAFPITKQEP